jgi:hypothetical protein
MSEEVTNKINRELRERFPYVCAWAMMTSSHPMEVNKKLEEAAKDNPSKEAVYKEKSGAWLTIEHLHPDQLRKLETYKESSEKYD